MHATFSNWVTASTPPRRARRSLLERRPSDRRPQPVVPSPARFRRTERRRASHQRPSWMRGTLGYPQQAVFGCSAPSVWAKRSVLLAKLLMKFKPADGATACRPSASHPCALPRARRRHVAARRHPRAHARVCRARVAPCHRHLRRAHAAFSCHQGQPRHGPWWRIHRERARASPSASFGSTPYPHDVSAPTTVLSSSPRRRCEANTPASRACSMAAG